jgi:hypothetical protein
VRDSRELTTYIEEREIGRAAHQTRQQVLLDETEYGFKRCTLLGLPQAAVASRLAHPSFQEHVFTLCARARNVLSGSKQVGPAELSLRNGRTAPHIPSRASLSCCSESAVCGVEANECP